MELSEKIQKLRKDRGLTQEQFAELLYVSRTAVSKWETGRGTPSIASLQMIAKICDIKLDELMDTNEIVAVAEMENRGSIERLVLRVDGIFSVLAVLSMFLPLYKVEVNGEFVSVPLYLFHSWLSFLYWLFPIGMALSGFAQFISGKMGKENVGKFCGKLSTSINSLAVFVAILSGQPYPAALFLSLLLIKGAIADMRRR